MAIGQARGPTEEDRHLSEHKSFADFAKRDAIRRLVQRGLEALDWFVKIFGAEAESLGNYTLGSRAQKALLSPPLTLVVISGGF
jgi:hypothetical protein